MGGHEGWLMDREGELGWWWWMEGSSGGDGRICSMDERIW